MIVKIEQEVCDYSVYYKNVYSFMLPKENTFLDKFNKEIIKEFKTIEQVVNLSGGKELEQHGYITIEENDDVKEIVGFKESKNNHYIIDIEKPEITENFQVKTALNNDDFKTAFFTFIANLNDEFSNIKKEITKKEKAFYEFNTSKYDLEKTIEKKLIGYKRKNKIEEYKKSLILKQKEKFKKQNEKLIKEKLDLMIENDRLSRIETILNTALFFDFVEYDHVFVSNSYNFKLEN